MTTPEQIIAKIEEIEKMLPEIKEAFYKKYNTDKAYHVWLIDLLNIKESVINVFNLPTADPPEGSPGQEDMKGMMKEDKQRQVLTYLRSVDKATLQEIYDNVNFGYYHNWAKHLGVLLKRMIDNGTIERVGRGVYKFKRERKFYEPNNENQINLFQ